MYNLHKIYKNNKYKKKILISFLNVYNLFIIYQNITKLILYRVCLI